MGNSELGWMVEMQDANNNTALHLLMLHGKPDDNLFKVANAFFTRSYASVVCNNQGEFPLLIAAKKGYFDFIINLCQRESNEMIIKRHDKQQLSELINLLETYKDNYPKINPALALLKKLYPTC